MGCWALDVVSDVRILDSIHAIFDNHDPCANCIHLTSRFQTQTCARRQFFVAHTPTIVKNLKSGVVQLFHTCNIRNKRFLGVDELFSPC